jgi:magnesium-transporting ATPase (P-type)
VLLDDNFATIVDAVEQGRATYANVRRFLTYHLTSNVAELLPFVVWALSGGQFPLALTVLQVLAIDIGTDLLPALALGAEPASERALLRPPARHLFDRPLLVRSFLGLGLPLALFVMATFVIVLFGLGWSWTDGAERTNTVLMASGAAWATVVIGQMGNGFACRSSTRAAWRVGRRNPFIVRAIAAEGLILVALTAIAPIASVFSQAAPPWWGWVCASTAFVLLVSVDAIEKQAIAFRRGRRNALGQARVSASADAIGNVDANG